MLDIDHFKRINDSWGHGVGDRAIKAVANVCNNAIRSIDMVGRLGGEEFGLILPETNLEAAQVVAERIRKEISDIQLDVGNGTYQFFATIGVAELHHSDMSFDDILQRADKAMYEGKVAGRNRVVASVLTD
jgi:diguanylate cyclase (GGDEF)-like protein